MQNIQHLAASVVLTSLVLAGAGCNYDHTIKLNVDENGDGQKESMTIDINNIDENNTEVTINRDVDKTSVIVDNPNSNDNPAVPSLASNDQKRLDFIKGLQSSLENYFQDHSKYPVQENSLTMQAKNDYCLGSDGFTRDACKRNYNMELYDTAPENFSYTYQSTAEKNYNYTISFELIGGAGNLTAGKYVASPSGIVKAPEEKPTYAQGGETPEQRDVTRLSNVKQIQTFLELYYSKNTVYPITSTTVVLGSENFKCLGENGFGTVGCSEPILALLPSDPLSPEANYVYLSTSGATYTIYFYLETDTKYFKAGKVRASPAGIKSE
jgi:hypothetical protein